MRRRTNHACLVGKSWRITTAGTITKGFRTPDHTYENKYPKILIRSGTVVTCVAALPNDAVYETADGRTFHWAMDPDRYWTRVSPLELLALEAE